MEPAFVGHTNWNHSIAQEGDATVVRMWVFNSDRYWGCEVLLEPRENGDAYFARFRPLTLTAADFLRNSSSLGDPARWNLQPPPAPAPQRIAPGETLVIDLMDDRRTGERLTGYLLIEKPLPLRNLAAEIAKMTTPELEDLYKRAREKSQGINDTILNTMVQAGNPGATVSRVPRTPAPAVNGPARDFAAEDAEIQISSPRVRVNGVVQAGAATSAGGPVPWFYLPGRGRYLLSLVARPGFAPSGVVEGRLIELKDERDSIALDLNAPFVAYDGTYIVFVKNEKEWQPPPDNYIAL